MQCFTLFVWALLSISHTSALAVSPFTHFTSKPKVKGSVNNYSNHTGSTMDTAARKRGERPFGEDDLFLSYFLNQTAIDGIKLDVAAAAAVAMSAKKTNTTLEARDDPEEYEEDDTRDYCELGKPGKVPLHKLPLCYQQCVIDNCCGKMMVGGPGDVRQLTTREFCDIKWIYVGDLIMRHIGHCTVDRCASSWPESHDASNEWMLAVCGDHWHRGYPYMHPPENSYEPNTC